MADFSNYIALCVLVSITVYSVTRGHEGDERIVRRRKRGLWDLCRVVGVFSNRSCVDYLKYGCWCGLGGSGTPIDESDECCYHHDKCYERLVCSGKFRSYSYNCSDKACYCKAGSGCTQHICECDMKFGQCLSNASFTLDHVDYNFNYCLHPAYRHAANSSMYKINALVELTSKPTNMAPSVLPHILCTAVYVTLSCLNAYSNLY